MRRPPRPVDARPIEFSPQVLYRVVLLALGLVAAGLLFEQLADLALLIAIAILLSLPLDAAATRLKRLGVPRPIGVVLALAAALAVLCVILIGVIPAFVGQVNDFVPRLPGAVAHLEHSLDHVFGLRLGTISHAVQRFVDRYTRHPSILLGPLSSIGMSVATAIGAGVVVIISALYIAVSPAPLVDGYLRLVAPENRAGAARMLRRVRAEWLGWLAQTAVDMLAFGGLLFVGMKLVGLPFAVGFAIFSALLVVVPGYGPLFGAVPAVAYGFAFSWHRAVLVVVVYLVAHELATRLIRPRLVRDPPKMHPAVIAVGVLAFVSLFGALGLFVAIPLISLTLIVIDELWVGPFGSRAASDEAPAPEAAKGALP